MMLEFLKSAIENIKERIKNPYTEKNATPFAGAFIIALILYNWQLFFSLISFDNNTNRLDKIDIIKKYLQEMNWMCRIGFPIIIAFSSIVFFYIFNNISLGITTFFNRWVKATVLYFTDKSKIITREELEKTMNKMNNLRVRYEELKKTFSESQSELEDYKNQIREKDGMATKTLIENEKLIKELESNKTHFQEKNTQITELMSVLETERNSRESAKREALNAEELLAKAEIENIKMRRELEEIKQKPKDELAYIYPKEVEFHINFFNKKYDVAETILKDLLRNTPNSDRMLKSKYIYYQACLFFALTNYREALLLLNESLEIEKNAFWNISLRILIIMILIEMNKYDEAFSSIEALRKYVERKNKINEVSQRNMLIFKVLREFEKTGFKYGPKNDVLDKMLKPLSEKNSDVAWNQYSAEMIPFHEWLQQKRGNF